MMDFPMITPVIDYLFTDFLAQNGLTIPFLCNMKKNNGNQDLSVSEFVKLNLEKKTPLILFFNRAFPWAETDEEYAYWARHAMNWVSYLQKLRVILGAKC